MSISPSWSSFHHSCSLDVAFGPACDVVWSHKAITRIISRGTPRPNFTVLGPAVSGNGGERATKTSKCHSAFTNKSSTPSGRISQASLVVLELIQSIGPPLLLFVLAARVGWTASLTICTSVRSRKFLQRFFLAGVKELWPVYCVFEHGRHPINLLLLFLCFISKSTENIWVLHCWAASISNVGMSPWPLGSCLVTTIKEEGKITSAFEQISIHSWLSAKEMLA